jgi:hypothetical protein
MRVDLILRSNLSEVNQSFVQNIDNALPAWYNAATIPPKTGTVSCVLNRSRSIITITPTITWVVEAWVASE